MYIADHADVSRSLSDFLYMQRTTSPMTVCFGDSRAQGTSTVPIVSARFRSMFLWNQVLSVKKSFKINLHFG